jgi:carboxyl-terminal processing protease
VREAENYEKAANWEKAREIYEGLLSQFDPGLNIRERYHTVLRHCWQVRRHQDTSYHKEVLSIEYGQALRLYSIVSDTILDGAVEKKKIEPGRLFSKGLEELHTALGDTIFLQQHVPAAKLADIEAFRALLRKTWGEKRTMSRKEAAQQIGEVAMAAESHLQLSATVVTMEFACGACYAIDEFTVYLTPNQLRELMQSLSNTEAVGVGLKLRLQNNKILVADVAPDGPANQLIDRNDQIISVDKKPVAGVSLEGIKDLLQGPVGSSVELELMSPMDMTTRLVRIQRRAGIPSVISFMLGESSFGYLKISGFTETTPQDVDAALAALSQDGMTGLILDLRDNGGGVFDSAIETARRFLSKGIITSSLHQDPKFNLVYHARNPNALSVPVTVLVDGYTASAAEVLAGALKDNQRGILIGQTTFGKGCMQCVLKLPRASGGVPTGGLKLTVARFFSPKGIPYSGRGIVPNIVIDDRVVPSQADAMMDSYVARAVAELNRMVAAQK